MIVCSPVTDQVCRTGEHAAGFCDRGQTPPCPGNGVCRSGTIGEEIMLVTNKIWKMIVGIIHNDIDKLFIFLNWKKNYCKESIWSIT